MGPLSSEQILRFKEEGFIVIRGLIEPDTVATWRQSLMELGHASADPPEAFDPDVEATWPRPWRPVPDFRVPVHQHPKLAAIAEQLGGAAFEPNSHAGASVLMTFSEEMTDAEWEENFRARTGHLDGYGGSGWYGGEMPPFFPVRHRGGW